MQNSDQRTIEKVELHLDELRQGLGLYQKYLVERNAEIEELNRLIHTIDVIESNYLKDGFKTKMNVGGNILMQARVPDSSRIYVNIGLSVYVDFSLAEARNYANFKIRILNKHVGVCRDACNVNKAKIKMALVCLANREA